MPSHNVRVSNVSQVFPCGAVVTVVSNNPAALSDGRGRVIYTDALGICIREGTRDAFYPWANVWAAEVSK